MVDGSFLKEHERQTIINIRTGTERRESGPRLDQAGPGAFLARPRRSAVVACHSATNSGSNMLILSAVLGLAFFALLVALN